MVSKRENLLLQHQAMESEFQVKIEEARSKSKEEFSQLLKKTVEDFKKANPDKLLKMEPQESEGVDPLTWVEVERDQIDAKDQSRTPLDLEAKPFFPKGFSTSDSSSSV